MHSKSFWYFHGVILAILWVIIAPLGVYIKRKSTNLHVLTFAIIDYGTLFFTGVAIYRIWPKFSNFF